MKKQMPLAQPTVCVEDNQTFLRWGTLRYWIDDLNPTTIDCVSEACAAVGVTTDLALLEAEIDERVDTTDGATAVYIDRRKWEKA